MSREREWTSSPQSSAKISKSSSRFTARIITYCTSRAWTRSWLHSSSSRGAKASPTRRYTGCSTASLASTCSTSTSMKSSIAWSSYFGWLVLYWSITILGWRGSLRPTTWAPNSIRPPGSWLCLLSKPPLMKQAIPQDDIPVLGDIHPLEWWVPDILYHCGATDLQEEPAASDAVVWAAPIFDWAAVWDPAGDAGSVPTGTSDKEIDPEIIDNFLLPERDILKVVKLR